MRRDSFVESERVQGMHVKSFRRARQRQFPICFVAGLNVLMPVGV